MPENIYYRWRVYSLGQGDGFDHWRQRPFQFYLGGNIWHPPKLIKHEGEYSDIIEEVFVKSKKEEIKSLFPKENFDMIETKVQIKEEKCDEDEDSDEIKPSHIGLEKLSNQKINRFILMLNNLSFKR